MKLLTLLLMLLSVGPGSLIPRPVSYETAAQTYTLREDGKDIRVRLGDRSLARQVRDLPAFAAEEAYQLTVSPRGVEIRALTQTGADRARQTLEQLRLLSGDGEIECCTLLDWPRYPYRGFMMDVSRHFRNKEFILKQLDAMALLKMSVLHLHLTDDAGWRMEVDSYPRLTELGAWRDGDTWTEWRDRGGLYVEEGTPGAYGGYLTKDDLREIVAYAAERHIDILPEVEMPGHSAEVTRAYPETACLGPDGQPVFNSDVCPGSEETFRLFEAVLDEMLEIFPSTMIHIGGDEAGKAGWRNCPRCQARMEKEGLKDVDELQSWMIHRMDRYLTEKGRKLVGWDEIMEGGLAPGATVMSWRGIEQGQEATADGHDAIMTPSGHVYLDYPQDDPMKEPVGFGSYQPLSRVYSLDPSEGMDPAAAAHVLGVQGNLWAEMILTDEHYEYMMYPRLLAIAEVGWTPQEDREYEEFRERALRMTELLRSLGYHPFDLASEVGERPESQQPLVHLGRGAKVTYATPYSEKYAADGDGSLTDGQLGRWNFARGGWQGFNSDLDVTLDLGEVRAIHYVGTTFLSSISSWICLPERAEISVSVDGKEFETVAVLRRPFRKEEDTMYILYGAPVNADARYVRLRAYRPDAPQHDWLFIDELVVN